MHKLLTEPMPNLEKANHQKFSTLSENAHLTASTQPRHYQPIPCRVMFKRRTNTISIALWAKLLTTSHLLPNPIATRPSKKIKHGRIIKKSAQNFAWIQHFKQDNSDDSNTTLIECNRCDINFNKIRVN